MPVPGDFARPLAGPGVDRVEGEVGLVVPGVVRRRPEDLAAALGDVLALQGGKSIDFLGKKSGPRNGP